MKHKQGKSTGFQFVEGPTVTAKQLLDLRHPAKALSLFQHKKSNSSLSGGHRSSFRGRGMDFDEVRIYQPGDDVRNIHWRVTARTTQTHTKVFKEEKERPLIFVIDQRNSMCFGSQVTYKSVMATELAALIGWAGLNDNDKVGGIVFNDKDHKEVKPKRSHHALLALLHQCSTFNQSLINQLNEISSSSISLHQILEKTLHLSKPGSAIFIVSDFHDYDQEAEKILSIIKRHADVNTLIIADKMEKNLPSHTLLSISDGIHKQQINTQHQPTLNKYQQAFLTKQKSLENSFSKLGVSSQLIWTHENPLYALQTFFRTASGKNISRKVRNHHAT